MPRSLVLVVHLSLFTVVAAQQPGTLNVSLPPFEYIGDSEIARGFATVRNDTACDITHALAIFRIQGPPTAFLGGEGCVNFDTPYVVHCSMPLIRAGESKTVQLYIGPIREARVHLTGDVAANTPPVPAVHRSVSFPRDFVVTNTGDSGPGSLRAAIEAANEACATFSIPCRVAFHIEAPVPANGWYTILPNTPLPKLTGTDIEIDGATQTAFGGDTNPLGPEIAIDGSALATGHGLEIAETGYVFIRNLAIGGFPWNGIFVTRDGFGGSIDHNYIGTDATGTRALPNRSRGITFDSHASRFTVANNLIAHNARSGIFIAAGYELTIKENTIRANPSGIFVGPDTDSIVIERNSIFENTQSGISVAQAAARYRLIDNAVTRNGFIGIDRGLDGFSGYDGNDQDVRDAKIPPPRVLLALYDPSTNSTTITGTYYNAFDHWGSWNITLYRSSINDGQGETVLGHTTATDGMFTLTVPGDLGGQFITATGHRALFLGLSGDWYWTTEFSEAVEVP